MKYLFDTHALIWWYEDDRKLTKDQKLAVTNPRNEILISVLNAWEMSIKIKKGKLQTKRDLPNYFRESDFQILPVTIAHALKLHELPQIHKDPFDRMLVAQALVEGCILISGDKELEAYDVPVLS